MKFGLRLSLAESRAIIAPYSDTYVAGSHIKLAAALTKLLNKKIKPVDISYYKKDSVGEGGQGIIEDDIKRVADATQFPCDFKKNNDRLYCVKEVKDNNEQKSVIVPYGYIVTIDIQDPSEKESIKRLVSDCLKTYSRTVESATLASIGILPDSKENQIHSALNKHVIQAVLATWQKPKIESDDWIA